jgi:hypothetical protein
MNRLSLVPAVLVLVVLAGCENRAPVDRGRAVSAAGNVLLQAGLDWGESVEVLPPSSPDGQGRLWFQVRYFTPQGEPPRVILVDAETAWGRVAPNDYAVRIDYHSPGVPVPPAKEFREGSFVLVLVEPSERSEVERKKLESTALRANQEAIKNKVPARFEARTDRQGRTSLLYGVEDGRGIVPEASLKAWAESVVGSTGARWLDLSGREP